MGLYDHRSKVHMLRVYAHMASVAPELPEAETATLLAALGWYLRPGVALKRGGAFATFSTVAMYFHGVIQGDRLRVDDCDKACATGWLLLSGTGRQTYTPTARGILAATIPWGPNRWPRRRSG